MQLNLNKGASFNLAKAISKINISAGWDPATKPGEVFDLDLWVLALTGGSLYGPSHAVVYANTVNRGGILKNTPNANSKAFATDDKSIVHTGDDRNGKASGVDEMITVDFSLLPFGIDEISIFISIYDAVARKQNFGRVDNTFVRITNAETSEDLCQYNPQKEFSDSTVVQIGSMVRDVSGNWSFKAVAAGAGAGADINTVLGAY